MNRVRFLLGIGLLASVLVFTGCPRRSVGYTSFGLGPHSVQVRFDPSSGYHSGSSGSNPSGDWGRAYYMKFEGGEAVLFNDELFINGKSYGKPTTGSNIEINTLARIEEGGEGPTVTINGAVVEGKETEESNYLIANESGIDTMIGDHRVVMPEGQGLYRIGPDHIWTPHREFRIKDGRVFLDGEDHGPLQPGDRIDIEKNSGSYHVLVNYERREPVGSAED